MTNRGSDVVIIGGGVVGMATAYFLGKAGVKSTVVERDSVGSHASGFAYGGLSPLGGAGVPGPVFPLSTEGMRLHRELSRSLPDETGINTEYRMRPSMELAFTEREAKEAKARLSWRQQQDGYKVRWLDAKEARAVEPRVSEKAIGAVHIEGTADLEPYRFVLALAQAAEKMGATVRHGRVTGLKRAGQRVIGVALESGEIPCERVVIAMGPWSSEASSWLGISVKVRPLKGQILRLRAPGPPIRCSVTWEGDYATTKPDGLVWAGTTEEEVGFDATPTTEARNSIMASLLKMMPSLADAALVRQTACLRPLSDDRLPILGAVPDWEGVYLATGAGRQGILLGPAMGQVTADLITTGASKIPIDTLSVGRFAK